MTAVVGARNLLEVYTSIVHALMQARYQTSLRGQFISEDPVFLIGKLGEAARSIAEVNLPSFDPVPRRLRIDFEARRVA